MPVSGQASVSRETILAGIGVAIVSGAFIALIWITALRSADEHRVALRDTLERGLTAQATTLAEKVKIELVAVDQTLAVMQGLWLLDPENFKLTDWTRRMPALSSVADDIFIADAARVIQQSVLPQAIGQGVGGSYMNFAHGSLEFFGADGTKLTDTRVITPTANTTIEARRYLMYVVRTLGTPPVAILGASYRSGEVTRHLADAQLGFNGMILMFDQRLATLQTVAGPAARRPRTALQRTEMYEAMRRGDGGGWIGPTSVDNVVRLHSWAKVPGRDSVVVVGTPLAQAMAPAEAIANGTRTVAIVASIVVVAAGVLVIWGIVTLRANRRRERLLERARADLAAAQTDVGANRLRATTATAQLRALLDGVTEAAGVFDTDLKLVTWNDRFLAAIGLEGEAIREGLPLDQLIRQQCLTGLFGPQPDAEAEIARRTQALLVPTPETVLTQTGPEGTPIPVLSRRMPDAGLVLILGGLATWQPAQVIATSMPSTLNMLEPREAENAVEW